MDGLIWTLLVWATLFLVSGRLRHRSPVLADWFSRENLALVLALLGTFSIAASADAAEVLREPLVVERIIRGAMGVTALLMILPLISRRLRGYTSGHRAMTGIMAYVGFALVSAMYSAAPLVTAAKVMELTAGLAPIVAIALGPEPGRRLRNTLLMIMAMIASLIIVSVVGFWVMPWEFAPVQTRPGFIFRQTMASPFAHPNTLSAHGAIIAVFCLAAFLSGRLPRRLTAIVGAFGVGALVLASGRQGVVILVVGAAVALWALRRSLFLLLLGPAAAWTGYVYRDALYSALARNRPDTFATLSGRLYWWESAINAWIEHPWTGWGYAAGGRFVALASIGSGRVSNVHSGYVESLVGVGILGIAGLAYALIFVISWSINHLRDETELAVLVVVLALRTAVSQGFGGWLNVEFVLFCLIVAIADQARIEIRQRRQTRTQTSLVSA